MALLKTLIVISKLHALHCHANSENWFEHLSLAMLGINASYNHAIKMSRAGRMFGKTLCLPSLFFARFNANTSKTDDPLLLQNLMKFFSKRSAAPINTHKDYEKVVVDKKLFETPSIYSGPYKVQKRFDKYFTIKTSNNSKSVSLDWLKTSY